MYVRADWQIDTAGPALYSVSAPPCHHTYPNNLPAKRNTQTSVAEPHRLSLRFTGWVAQLLLAARSPMRATVLPLRMPAGARRGRECTSIAPGTRNKSGCRGLVRPPASRGSSSSVSSLSSWGVWPLLARSLACPPAFRFPYHLAFPSFSLVMPITNPPSPYAYPSSGLPKFDKCLTHRIFCPLAPTLGGATEACRRSS
jgi:hypothetical protein